MTVSSFALSFALASLVACLSACGSGPHASARPAESAAALDSRGGYTVRLHRQMKVGDRFRVVETFRLERVTTVRRGEDVVEHVVERRSATIDADVLVVAVTDDGKVLERRLTVHGFRYELNGVPGAPIPRGSIIRVIGARDGQGVIEWNGRGLPRDAQVALRSVVSTVITPSTDDEVFGTDVRQPIGARWPIDTARAATDLASLPGLELAPERLRGASVLRGATQRHGIDCLRVETALEADLSSMPAPRDDATITAARLQVDVVGCYPIDRRLPELEGERTTTLRATGTVSGEDGPATLELVAAITAGRDVTPLEAAGALR